MKSDAIAFGAAGIVFGMLAGWILGFQHAASRPAPPAAAPASQTSAAPAPPPLDEARVSAFRSVAEKEPANAEPRIQLGNLYLSAERFDDAINWYEQALKIAPNNAAASTDLGIAYYYTNQPDKAIAQFDRSLALNPKDTKTMLHLGVVRAFGKQDLDGAVRVWEQVVKLSPDSQDGQAARRAIESVRTAHPPGAGEKPST